jgi:hypothetical protein
MLGPRIHGDKEEEEEEAPDIKEEFDGGCQKIVRSSGQPDASLYMSMRCILVYKKYRSGQVPTDIFLCHILFIHEYVDIKKYRPGQKRYVTFMLSHTRG